MAVEGSRLTGGKVSSILAAALLLGAIFLTFFGTALPASARPVSSSIMVDAQTGEVLSASNADAITYPASLTKMMTLYLLFDALKHGQIKMDDMITFSDHAAAQEATNLSVSAGDTIRVETAILAIVVRSANDAATAVGERLGGTEWAFAQTMTQTARALGMTHTVFRNANGLPNPAQHTTARDMATLAIALLRDFPEYYHYFSAESFTYHGVKYAGHNHVLDKFSGADGMKTGYIRASGFNVVTSAERNGRRMVGVVLGGQSPYLRDKQMVALMTKAFAGKLGSTGTRLALSAPASASGRPVQVAAAAPAIATAAVLPVGGNTASRVAKAAATTPAVVASQAIADDPIANKGGALLPVLKPGTDLNLASAAATPDPQAIENVWRPEGAATYGVQVGAYSQYSPAQKAAVRVSRIMPSLFADARIVIDQNQTGNSALYRARLMGLTKVDAERACAKLKAKRSDCMVLNADEGVARAN
jgi:D-alanyl-D-alanine carboxypeptidase